MTKHVLITGGSDGLGKATAKKLIEVGNKVTILSREESVTKAAAQELGCAYVIADVADYQQVEVAFRQAQQAQGPVDILINCAGVWITGPLESNSPEAIARAMMTNALGTIYCVRAVIPSMKERKAGRIINVNSVAGQRVKAERAAYTATKWAVTGFTGSIRDELRPYNIAVTDFFPAAMNTQLFNKVGDHSDRTGALDPAIAADALLYICQLPDHVDVSEFSIQSLEY